MTKVTLREKPMASGKASLYLDFYPAIPHPTTHQLTRREFLRLHVFQKPQTPLERQHNKATRAQANHILAQRRVALAKEHYDFLAPKKQSITLKTFFEQSLEQKKAHLSTASIDIWRSMQQHLLAFAPSYLPTEAVTKTFCLGFRDFLLSKAGIASSTAQAYWTIFKQVIRNAHEHGLIKEDLADKLPGIRRKSKERSFLTLEELQCLDQTPCPSEAVKRAALFSALVGLRGCDIKSLQWGAIEHSAAMGYQLHFRQQKTGNLETLPLCQAAYDLLGEAQSAATPLFAEFKAFSRKYINAMLRKWTQRAGIPKHITFHCFRHSFATLQLTLGTDIYTVSKLLGHRSVATTQIYGRIIDEKKKAAAHVLTQAWEQAMATG